MGKLAFFVSICVFGFVFNLRSEAQSTNPSNLNSRGSLTAGSLDSQFIYLNWISKSQEDFKLVRRRNLDLIKQNVLDSVQALRSETFELKKVRDELQDQLKVANDSLQSVSEKLIETVNEKKSIKLLGISFSPISFNIVILGIIILLIALLVFAFIRLTHNNITTKESKDALNNLQDAFDQHRKKSLEKEQKLMRQLQDEINKRNS